MRKPNKDQVWQAGGCILCIAVLWARLDDLGNSEFVGGWLTGRLFEMADFGSVLFLLAFPLTFFFRRAAAVLGLAGCLLTCPLYLFFLFTFIFRAIFGGEWKGMWAPFYSWNAWKTWAMTGTLTLASTAWVCVRTFSVASKHSTLDQVAGS